MINGIQYVYPELYISANTIGWHSRVLQWGLVTHTVSEVHKFLGVTIVMGLVNYPRVEDYWVTPWPFATPTHKGNTANSCFYTI